MSAVGHKRTKHLGPKSGFVRCYSNSGQTRLRLDCPLSARSGLMHCSKFGEIRQGQFYDWSMLQVSGRQPSSEIRAVMRRESSIGLKAEVTASKLPL